MNRTEIWGLTGLGGHETEFSGLHPRLQANLAEAQAVLSEMVNGLYDNHITTLGITTPREGIDKAYFAAIDRTGAKAHDLGYRPEICYMGEPVDLYEVPNGLLVTVQSEISARAAIVMVTFTDVNANGYGDWDTATAGLIGLYTDLDEAKAELRRISRALATLKTVARQLDRVRAEARPDSKPGLSF